MPSSNRWDRVKVRQGKRWEKQANRLQCGKQMTVGSDKHKSGWCAAQSATTCLHLVSTTVQLESDVR